MQQALGSVANWLVYFCLQISMPNNTMLNVVAWNQEKGYLAAGGDQGLLKVLKLESGKG